MRIKREFERISKKIFTKKSAPYLLLLFVLTLSIAYSAFGTEMNIGTFLADVRLKQDIRITGVGVTPETENPFALGTEYKMELGDGVLRTFYVLEDGDNTTLTKSDGTLHYQTDKIGTAGPGEVALIMNENYDMETVLWCASGSDVSCNGSGLEPKLTLMRNAWTKLESDQIGIPTYNQLYNVNNSEALPNWLISNLDRDNPNLPYGYWTASAKSETTNIAYSANYTYALSPYGVYIEVSFGVRPIITIPKNQLATLTNDIIQNNEGTSAYQDYNVNNISAGINLPNENSSVTYAIEITNLGNVEMGILEVTGLPDNLDYKFLNYNEEEKICDEENECISGISKEVQLKIMYKEGGYDSSNTNYNIVANFNFQPFYTVTYTDIENNNYPSEVIANGTLEVDFGESAPSAIKVVMGTQEITNYTYENGILTVPNVSGNIEIQKGEESTTQVYTPQYYGLFNGTVDSKAAPENPSTVPPTGKNVYLGYDVTNGVVSTVYVCFTRNDTEYCLKGADTEAYDSNKKMLEDAFKDVENACSFADDESRCSAVGLEAEARSDGYVYGQDDYFSMMLTVNANGSFVCLEFS